MRFNLLIALTATALLTACGKPAETASTPTSAPTDAAPAWLLASMPADARPVAEIKKSAAEGDKVVMQAKVGGRVDPITKGVAVFVVMDPAINSCDQNPGDMCSTPWDYCCEPKEVMTANSATIQIVGPDGKPLALDLATQGLKPLQHVVIVGTVGPRPNDAVLVVNATGVHIATN